MCITYKAVDLEDLDKMMEGRPAAIEKDWPDEIWRDYAAPIIRATEDGKPELIIGTYGITPQRAYKEKKQARDTMDARVETIGELRSFASAWRNAQTCLVPCKWFYEPRYEYKGAPAERWAIGAEDNEAFCVAGLWREWHFDGETQYGFTQITTDAIDHPLLNQFHKDAEKRGLIILPRNEYEEWLNVKDMEFARAMLTRLPAKPDEGMAGREAIQ